MKVNISNYRKKNGQKTKVQIDRWDIYSMDHTLANIILPMLIALKENKQGIPGDFFNQQVGSAYDNNYCFDFIEEDRARLDDIALKGWNEALDKMIWSFYQIVSDDYDNKYHHGKIKFIWDEADPSLPVLQTTPGTGVYELRKHPDSTHWYDRVGHEEHEQRIQEGLDLFAKHYRSLWD
jgi:hypothetical protein